MSSSGATIYLAQWPWYRSPGHGGLRCYSPCQEGDNAMEPSRMQGPSLAERCLLIAAALATIILLLIEAHKYSRSTEGKWLSDLHLPRGGQAMELILIVGLLAVPWLAIWYMWRARKRQLPAMPRSGLSVANSEALRETTQRLDETRRELQAARTELAQARERPAQPEAVRATSEAPRESPLEPVLQEGKRLVARVLGITPENWG